ncbi:MAG: GNAT family N-acetyltransferase [Anaerolineales bacterium]|nr:GNAT family N-acetyltransferase [Anaerolineales bacterium]
MVEVRSVQTARDRRSFLTFPWRIYSKDPLWVPPLLPEREKVIDPKRGLFFKQGYAELFIAWKDGKPAGTISCAEDEADSRERGHAECMFGFFECVEEYAVAEALLGRAEDWARTRRMSAIYGPFNLDREDSRGILVEGYDRPPAMLCAHHPPYYRDFCERFGLIKRDADNLAYSIDIDLNTPQVRRLSRLAERVRRRKAVTIRGAKMDDLQGEIDRVWDLQNRALAHLPGFISYTRESIESLVMPLKDLADPELVLFAEMDGKAVGWFPAIPNYNEVLIHLNGLRYPWDYLRALRYRNKRPESISIKSIVVPPEFWDTGVAILLFDEMARRAASKGYKWADMSLTGEDNPDTWDLAHNMGAKVYKRYRFYRKEVLPQS